MSGSQYTQLPHIELEGTGRPGSPPSPPFSSRIFEDGGAPASTPGNGRATPTRRRSSHSNASPSRDTRTPEPGSERRPSTNFSLRLEKLHEGLTPSQHYLLDPSQKSTVRRYDKKGQRRRLWRLTIGEFFITIILSLSYFLILFKYSKRDTISSPQRRTFNALITTNSLLLGVNLSASLRSYAKMMRWRMLSIAYRSLESFDLVMGCDSLINIIKLLYKGRISESRWKPSRTQAYAFLWLLVNIAATVLIGIIGLTYSLDSSKRYVLSKSGTIEIIDLSSILSDDLQASLSAVNSWGVRGYLYEPICSDWPTHQFNGFYEGCGNGVTRYHFVDWNLDGTHNIISKRYLDNEANCDGYLVKEGAEGNLNYVVYDNGVRLINQSLPEPPGPAGLAVLADTESSCGDRCTHVEVFIAKSDKANGPNDDEEARPQDAYYFRCTNQVSTVFDHYSDPGEDYQFPNHQARILAGAIGWAGEPVDGDTRQYVRYPASNQVHFDHSPDVMEVAELISGFSTKAIAAMDTIYPGIDRKSVKGAMPIDAQVLTVDWKWTGMFLGLLPFMHFWIMMAVIIWANKAVIKDDSHLAVAKAYYSLLKRLGDTGCMLRGDEIVKQLGDPRVIYGFTTPGTTQENPGHVDVFDDESGVVPERSFREGTFDGEGNVHHSTRLHNHTKLKAE